MVESIKVDFKECSLEPLEPDKLRKLIGLTHDVGAMLLFVHSRAVLEVTGPGFVIVAAGKVLEEEFPNLGFGEPRHISEVVTRVTCVCSDWDVGMGQVEAQQVFSNLQSAGPKYDFSMFKYCPWCGTRLFEFEKSKEVIGG